MVMDDLEMISNCKRLGRRGRRLFARFQVLLQFQTIETFIIQELLIKIKGLVGDDKTSFEHLRKETEDKEKKKWCLVTRMHRCMPFLYKAFLH